MTSPLLDREHRSNPLYELVLFDRLAPEERRALGEVPADFYGVLRPRPGAAGLAVQAVDREIALLFLTLREPGPVPAYVRALLGEAAARTLGRLVADGVFEVAKDGGWVSGPAALEMASPEGKGGRLADLSRAALRYGQALPVEDPRRLSLRLYGYNRQPLAPSWRRLLPSADAVRRHLGMGPEWTASGSGPWLSRGAAEPAASPDGATWKLYVSPAPEALAACSGDLLAALAAARAPRIKVGSDAANLLRPDKIVAYFPSFGRLGEAAEAVAARLAGVPAQGVPFTSEIAGDGLLSWGVDPAGQESWRLWLTHRLARALISARTAPAEGIEPWRFALERLRLEGIDTQTWAPDAGFGKEP